MAVEGEGCWGREEGEEEERAKGMVGGVKIGVEEWVQI